ncbi:MAG: UTP--glucose-1-phosphate uridylyltransferase, partial [Deltaproteobacteria bacterium]|nr:UTP--glucose-1-phosphate uridylyltransferase [Deltaproteobacteria bacterium]
MPPKIKKAVIPAAGLGTRFLPATKVVPKELLPIVDKPGIQYIVEEAIAAGVEEIIFVISPDKKQVADHFRPAPELEKYLRDRGKTDMLKAVIELQDKAKYTVVMQEKPLGLGHAVFQAREAIGDEWFFVFLPDDLIDHEVPCAVQMLKSWEVHNGAILAVMQVAWEEVHQYGVVKAAPLTASLGKVESIIEKPKREQAPSNLAVIGRYILPPDIFSLLEKLKPGAIGEIQLTDALAGLVKKTGLYALEFEGERFDIGNKPGFLEANINYALKHEGLSQKALD